MNSVLFDKFTKTILQASAVTAIGFLLIVLSTLVHHGIENLNFSFLINPSSGAGYSGGVRYQILGTLILVATGALFTVPFSVAYALFYTHYSKSPKIQNLLFVSLHLVNSTPSILFGILGYLLFFKALGWQKSWLSGGIILGVMMLPTVTESLIERMKTLPNEYVLGAKAMGFSDDRLVLGVILPYAWGGLLTGLVLGIARAAGETAPILFTATVFSGATLPDGIIDNPVLALPNHVFNLAQDVSGDEGMKTAWSTAAVLTLLSASLSLMAIPFRARSHEEARV